ncbi:hypothetical protein C8R43DRAFT_940527 [Mycena crocata]|nr:hypothetical protein C8R43DRAFT_940527 [Mycena crocata]
MYSEEDRVDGTSIPKKRTYRACDLTKKGQRPPAPWPAFDQPPPPERATNAPPVVRKRQYRLIFIGVVNLQRTPAGTPPASGDNNTPGPRFEMDSLDVGDADASEQDVGMNLKSDALVA